MKYGREGFALGGAGNMGTWSARAAIFGGLMALVSAGSAQAQTPERPAVGGIGSPPDAMIFYRARRGRRLRARLLGMDRR
jgi:hypothetical protein